MDGALEQMFDRSEKKKCGEFMSWSFLFRSIFFFSLFCLFVELERGKRIYATSGSLNVTRPKKWRGVALRCVA